MAIVYSAAIKTARMQAVADLIDAGVGAGSIEIGTNGMSTVLATFALPEPCGTAAAGVLTLDMDPDLQDVSADATGTAAAAQIKDGDGNIVISGLTVGTSGTDIVLDSVSITAGQTVTLTDGTITHAA